MKRVLVRALAALAAALACGPGAAALDLNAEGFIRRVDTYSRQLELARLDTATADAERRGARAGALPRLSAQAGYGRETLDQPAWKVPSYKNSMQVGATATQNLFNMSVVYALKASRLLDSLTAASVEATRQAVINEARKAFYGAILARETRAVKRDSEARAGEQFAQMRARFASGVASEYDLLNAEAAYRASTPPRLRAERDYELALNSLKILAGIDVAEPVELIGSLDKPAESASGAGEAAEQRERPDLAAAEWQRKLYEVNLLAAESARYPTVAASLQYTATAASDELAWQNDSGSLQVGLGVTVPIFTGGATESLVSKARVDLQKSATRVAQLRDEARIETTNTRLRLEEARQSVDAASGSVDSARRAYEIAQTRLDNRLATQLELNQVRAAYDEARLGFYAAVYDLLAARFDWELMMGAVPAKGDLK